MRSPLLSLLLAVAVALPMAAYAGGKGGHKKKKAAPAPIHRVIKSISEDSITVGDAIQTLTYKITPKTLVAFKGNKATLKDLQVGMKVSVATGLEYNVAERISADDPPKAAPATAKAHKKK